MLNKNDVVTLDITALTNEGSGVGHYGADENSRGMAVFVPFTAVGDVISCRIVKVLKRYAYGRLEAILTASPDRVENYCPVYGKCGGCCFRHISYEAELRAKEGFVRDAFGRIGGLSPEMLPIRGSESVDGYRNKLQMPLSRQDGRTVCGAEARELYHNAMVYLVPERSHRVIPTEKCALQPEIFAEIANFVTEQADRLRISIYNEEKHEGVLRHVYLRRGHYSGEICLCLVARRKVPEFQKLAKSVTERFQQITGVVLNINREKTNVILGDEEIVLAGKPDISDTMCTVKVEISPRAFYQVNTPAAEALYAQAAEFAEPEGKLLLDLYCGAGTIGLSMADKAEELIGIETVAPAIEDAKKNAAANGIENARFICADAGEAAEKLLGEGKRPEVIVLDPPRKGCSEQTIKAAAKMAPDRIVYVSCDPATLARDCAVFKELGYEVEEATPVDLFPRTAHVETVCLLSRAI